MERPYLVVAGNIGVGKSTAVAELSVELKIPAIEETERNPWLERFYADPRRWAFHSQAWFLQQGMHMHSTFSPETGGVQSRSVHEHFLVFAHHLRDDQTLSRDEFQLLSGLYYGMQDLLPAPDLLIMLKEEPEQLLEQARKDTGEDIALAYLQGLEKHYRSFVDGWVASPVLEFDCNQYGLQEQSSRSLLVDRVLEHLAAS